MIEEHINFEKASIKHQEIIFNWLAEPHMQEFWDNSQEHKDDILNFIYGRQQHYFYGTTQYWIGYINNQPFCFLLTDQILRSQENLSELHKKYLSSSDNTIALDFGIGNTVYLGKNLAAPTLKAFMEFYRNNVDPKTDTFFIDPDKDNSRAIYVYEKAGFTLMGAFETENGAFKGQQNLLLVKKYT